MATNAENAYEKYRPPSARPRAAGEWMEVDQSRIDAFADVTEDHQFIHVDPEMAAQLSPWKDHDRPRLPDPVAAHAPRRARSPRTCSRYEGVVMGVNYGFDKVRFVNPVKVGRTIRATSVLTGVDLKDPNSSASPARSPSRSTASPSPPSSPTGSPASSTADPARTGPTGTRRTSPVTVGHRRSYPPPNRLASIAIDGGRVVFARTVQLVRAPWGSNRRGESCRGTRGTQRAPADRGARGSWRSWPRSSRS